MLEVSERAADELVNESGLLIVEGRLSPHVTNRVLDVPATDVGVRRHFTLQGKSGDVGIGGRLKISATWRASS